MDTNTLKPRLEAIEQQLIQAMDALATCQADLGIHQRIESTNAREIERLKRHIAALQRAEPTPAPGNNGETQPDE